MDSLRSKLCSVITLYLFVIIIHYDNTVLTPTVEVISLVGFNHQLQKVTADPDQKDSIVGPDHLNHQKNCFNAQRKTYQEANNLLLKTDVTVQRLAAMTTV